jgi:hypothetical protein
MILLPEELRLRLEDQQARLSDVPVGTLPRQLAQALLGALPDDLHQACSTVLHGWGTIAHGTDQWTVRPLFRHEEASRLSVLLSYRCGSSHSGYSEYYDERLAILNLRPTAAYLRLIPLAEDCERCADLYHIELSRSFPFEKGRLVELRVTNSSDNPCCDGPETWGEERLLYLALPDSQPVLWLKTGGQRRSHDDLEGDSEETCRSDLSYEVNDSGYLREITSKMTCRIDGDAALTQTQRYRWRPELRRFEQVSAP